MVADERGADVGVHAHEHPSGRAPQRLEHGRPAGLEEQRDRPGVNSAHGADGERPRAGGRRPRIRTHTGQSRGPRTRPGTRPDRAERDDRRLPRDRELVLGRSVGAQARAGGGGRGIRPRLRNDPHERRGEFVGDAEAAVVAAEPGQQLHRVALPRDAHRDVRGTTADEFAVAVGALHDVDQSLTDDQHADVHASVLPDRGAPRVSPRHVT